jgi:hypothetical protein
MLNCGNAIFDHCTFSHGGDESASWAGNLFHTNVTIQNCFFQDSKTGTITGADTNGGNTGLDGDFSFINNLYSNVSHRFPNPKSNGRHDIINNIVYNWKSRLIRTTHSGDYNIINNYNKPSNGGLRDVGWFGTNSIPWLHKVLLYTGDTPLIYTAGNIVTGQRETPQTDDSDMFTAFATSQIVPEDDPVPAQFFTSTQFPLIGQAFTIKTADQAYTDLVINKDVGAYKTLNADGSINTYYDTSDASHLAMIKDDTYSGSFYDSKSTVAYPTIPNNTRPESYYNNSKSADIPEDWFDANMTQGDLSTDLAPSGYTWVEEFINSVDGEVVSGNTSNNIPQTDVIKSKRKKLRLIRRGF